MLLEPGIERKEARGEAVQRQGAARCIEGHGLVDRTGDAVCKRVEPVRQGAEGRARALGEGSGLRLKRGFLVRRRIEAAADQDLESIGRDPLGRGTPQVVGQGLHGGGLPVEHRGDVFEVAGREPLHHAGEAIILREIRVQAGDLEGEAGIGLVREGRAVPGQLGAERRHVGIGDQRGHGGEVLGRVRGDPVEHLGLQGRGGGVVHFGKAGGQAGFEREAAQQARAEGVDGLDLEPAGRFDRAGEETARLGERLGVEVALDPEFCQHVAQPVVFEHGPFAEAAEQAVLHLARGGGGVGEAEDVLGRRAVEEQAGHPVGEDPRLARPSVGRKPGADARVGGIDLGLGGIVSLHGLVLGVPSSSSGPTRIGWARSVRPHSPRRAR